MIDVRLKLWLRLYGRKDKIGWWSLPNNRRLCYLLNLNDVDFIYGDSIKFEYDFSGACSMDWPVDIIVDELENIMLMQGLNSLPIIKRVSGAELIDLMLIFEGSKYQCVDVKNGIKIRRRIPHNRLNTKK